MNQSQMCVCVFERVVCLSVLCEPITDVCVCVCVLACCVNQLQMCMCVFERVV